MIKPRRGFAVKKLALGLTPALAILISLAGQAHVVTAAASTPLVNSKHRLIVASSATTESRNRVASRLAVAVHDFRRSANLPVQKPSDPVVRLGFSTNAALLKAMIREARRLGGPSGPATAAEIVLVREMRRLHDAWKAADQKAQVAAIVRQPESLSSDAARASGARSQSEVNAFKRAHLADVRYASRRWLIEKTVGRQGAVILSRGAHNARLRKAIEERYRYGAKVGDGGTADKLIAEVRAGCLPEHVPALEQGTGFRKNLLKILSEEPLSPTERQIAGELIGTLTKAIRVAGGK